MTIQVRVRASSGLQSVSLIALAAAYAFLPAMTSPARAQDVTPLEGIVIHSANRTPTDAAKVGSSVEVITERDIQAQSKTFLKDYLEQVTGVNLTQTGSFGGSTGISIRGASQSYVKVLIDGMDVSDPSGTQTATAFEHLLVGDVSRTEILKGPQSTLYGGDAVGGVISIETKGATRPGFFQSGGVEYGRYNTFKGAYSAGYATENGSDIAFTVQGIDTDGFSARAGGSEKDGYRNLTLSGRGRLRVSEAVSLFFAARSLDARSHFDNTTPINFDVRNLVDTQQQAGRVGADISLLGGRFQSQIAFQAMQLERSYRDELYGASKYEGDRLKAEYKGVLAFNNMLSMVFGADWERTRMSSTYDPTRHEADVVGTYAQFIATPVQGLQLTAGGRIDDHDRYGDFSTYRLTAAYQLPGTETIFRGSYGTGFRAPSLYELFGLGQTDLRPETSKGWDAGIEQGFWNGRVKLSATYFELDTSDLIIYVSNPAPPPWGSYENVDGTTERKGVELSAKFLVHEGLIFTTGYTYVDTETAAGTRLPRVPRHTFIAAVDAEPFDKVALNVTARYVADNLDLVAGTTESVDDYFLLGAKLSYEFMPGVKAYVRGENLLNENYQTAIGYNTPGLSVYGGVTFALPSN